MKLWKLCQAAGIEYPDAYADLEITKIISDSRLCEEGCLYICIRGLHTDGHTYIAEALQKGAVCVLVEEAAEQELPTGALYLTVRNTRRAEALLCNAFFGDPVSKMKFIGVTGTNGKTSITHMLRAILEASLCKCGLVGTLGYLWGEKRIGGGAHNTLANMTTPDPYVLYPLLAQMAEDGVEYVLMEVSSHALALEKLAPICFEAGIFTNLTPDHLDFHKTMDAYAEAKAGLFKKCKKAIINADSPYAEKMLQSAVAAKTCTAERRRADYRAEAIHLHARQGVEFKLCSNRTHLQLKCPIAGGFTVMNAMQAAICALELGFGAPAVKTALASMGGVKGRMERVRLGMAADFDVLIDYAHTPDALQKLLQTARETVESNGRVVLLFGCGGDRDKSKRSVMGRISVKLADAVIVTSDNSRSEDPEQIIADILEGMETAPVTVIPNRRDAIRYAVLNARRGDLILLAGKGHEEYEIDKNGKSYFSETEIVKQAFEERLRQEGTEA